MVQLDAIESRVAYPEKTFDNNYLTTLYGEVSHIKLIVEYLRVFWSVQYDFSETGYVGNFLQYIIISHQQLLSLAYKPIDRNQSVNYITIDFYI